MSPRAGTLRLTLRDSLAIRRQPVAETQQLRVQRTRCIYRPRGAEVSLEIALELEHVSEVLGAGKSESAIHARLDRVVANFFAEEVGKRRGHFRSGEVLAGDADALPDQLRPLLEDPVRAAADVLRRDTGQLRVSDRQRDGELAG